MFVVQIWCLYLVNRLLYGVLPETTFFDKNGRTWPQFDLYNFWPWVNSGKIFKRMRRIDARRSTENFKALFPTEFELLAKNQQGGPLPPPPSSGRGLKPHWRIPPDSVGLCTDATVLQTRNSVFWRHRTKKTSWISLTRALLGGGGGRLNAPPQVFRG